ncbi:hemopexin repeat-containing protein [Streptomyces sp. CS131]|uniref:hemopexin repeat-containing protein n=1 Tax=Streptomyces sp. CS131 TaxID=2162711 RepID=UPI0013A5394C|nr:hemopexin repeat-containing protein [Streptomyces sp. CS131]
MATDVQESFNRRIHAVLRSRDEGRIAWFFKDSQYVRYDLKDDKGVSGPKRIQGNWHGVPESFTRGIDAARNRRDKPDVGYLFKDDQYVRYDLAADRAGSGFPKTIEEGWSALPAAFQLGIDAAANHHSDHQVVWFFKDDQYVRYNAATDKLLAGPAPISQGWHGLPDSFTRRIDAAAPHVTDPPRSTSSRTTSTSSMTSWLTAPTLTTPSPSGTDGTSSHRPASGANGAVFGNGSPLPRRTRT